MRDPLPDLTLLLGRISAATARHPNKPWRVRRIKHLRAGLLRAYRTMDRQLLAEFFAEYGLTIECEMRSLEGQFADERIAA